MIKLVISDVDGTIIGRDEQLPSDAGEFVRGLRQKGILFTVATGRSEQFMAPMIARMGIECPYVCSNGATVMQGMRTVQRKQFPIRDARDVLETAQAMGMSMIFTSCGVDRIVEDTRWLQKEAAKHRTTFTPEPFTEHDWETYRVEKILIMDEIRDGRIGAIEALCRNHPEAYSYVRYRDKAVELMERTANKADGIRRLLQETGIGLSEVLVVGDDDNDREMFQLGAKSAAVANASRNILHLVDYRCERPQFEGVKEAVLRCWEESQ